MNLDELPTRCAIAESCGLVSILSGIVSSHSSIGLKIETTLNKLAYSVNEQFDELRTTMCNMATQMAEHFGRIDSRLMKHDSILNQLNDKRRSDLLHQSRFQRWSKTGADAIEIFDDDFIIKTGNTFTLRQRPENEKTNFVPKTLFSPVISSDVAQLSFTINHTDCGFRFGAASAHYVDTATARDLWRGKHGIACWGEAYSPNTYFQARGVRSNQKTVVIVLEADCGVGQRTLKLSDNEAVHSDFYSNLSLPFRFAIALHHPSVSVTIHSLTFTAKPTLKGGTKEIKIRD
ncbi:hypothetical protein BLNAU_13384 [Blattamonas nauphoetae]|uniref:Uncharacterized protein n=1 Tax=Blattamonas nauphoetae TaxID=2049346 RepID=A0ABQ9XKB6_9EUKA|nr:hypothetical protein BLNAU_13384 [Blattamonas nauphoetae]